MTAPDPPAPGDPPEELEVTIQGTERIEEEPEAAVFDRFLARWRIDWGDLRLVVLVSLVIVATTITGTLLFAQTQSSQFLAQADLVVDTSDLTNTGLIDRRVATLQIIAESPLVMDAVSEATGVPTSEVEGALRVDALSSAAVIRFRATRPDSESALALVTAASEQFLVLLAANPLEHTSPESGDSSAQTSGPLEAAIRQEIEATEASLALIEEQFAAIDAERSRSIAAGLPPVETAQEAGLLIEYDILHSQLASLKAHQLELVMTRRLEAEVEPEQVLSAVTLGYPRVIGEEGGLPMKHALAIGGFAGMVLAGLTALSILLLRASARGEAQPAGMQEEPPPSQSGG